LTNDLEDFAGCSLVFERFFEVTCAFAQFAEEPCVLHRDDRLRSEILQQLDLLVGEWTDFLTVGGDITEKSIFLPQRHEKQRADAAEFDRGLHHRVIAGPCNLGHIVDLKQALALHDPRHGMVVARKPRSAHNVRPSWWEIALRG
jgi:hypothetical protein